MPGPIFVLIHSPLVGPFTWALVADELRRGGQPVVVPTLRSEASDSHPYWEQHAQAVAAALVSEDSNRPVILAGHSGAGPILPAIRQSVTQPVAAYLFIDAGLPEEGKSRLDLFDDPQAANRFRQAAQGGFIPPWTAEDLREVIPNDRIRERFAGELRPLPLAVYEEPLPVFPGWPDAPCSYLRFGSNPAYEASMRRAVQEGFSVKRMGGEHFHMLVEPGEVAQALIALCADCALR